MANEDLTTATLYFGYGSNLWIHQMQQRCPRSRYLGIARLSGYRWIINERGYANIVEVERDGLSKDQKLLSAEEVWGLVYSLEQHDEEQLDKNEGVPVAYTKENLEVEFWQSYGNTAPNLRAEAKQREMLVYINRRMVAPDKPKKEYIYRMNMGIKDALNEGVPKHYVENVIRKFIPDVDDETVAEVARKQALVFEDER